eukprot:TRINITY_DN29264_c0_g1_i1.p1 TRINITY_DN29264_c0_g1~~TRINITY_DN29264_c0_g1_i1.p1  ORF type:complete len:1019 (-),score=158.87 TRINITY_DN29264_c0_g1_i1:31-3087(-)
MRSISAHGTTGTPVNGINRACLPLPPSLGTDVDVLCGSPLSQSQPSLFSTAPCWTLTPTFARKGPVQQRSPISQKKTPLGHRGSHASSGLLPPTTRNSFKSAPIGRRRFGMGAMVRSPVDVVVDGGLSGLGSPCGGSGGCLGGSALVSANPSPTPTTSPSPRSTTGPRRISNSRRLSFTATSTHVDSGGGGLLTSTLGGSPQFGSCGSGGSAVGAPPRRSSGSGANSSTNNRAKAATALFASLSTSSYPVQGSSSGQGCRPSSSPALIYGRKCPPLSQGAQPPTGADGADDPSGHSGHVCVGPSVAAAGASGLGMDGPAAAAGIAAASDGGGGNGTASAATAPRGGSKQAGLESASSDLPPARRPHTSPAGGAVESSASGCYIPNYSAARVEAFVVNKEKRRTFPPRLREHLQLNKLLSSGDFKRCLVMVADTLHQLSSQGSRMPEETAEEFALRTAALECSLVGPIEDARFRKVLLLWVLAVSLEAVGEVRTAVLLFSQCLDLDPENPTHPYHRGVCLLRLGRPKAACSDFDLAVCLCAARDMEPPLVFIANRALAGASMPERASEVWADFELARRRCGKSELPAYLAQAADVTWESYKQMISTPVPPNGSHRHWVSVLVARCHRNFKEIVSDVEAIAFIRFLRGLPGMAFVTRPVVIRMLRNFGTLQLAEGQVLLLEANWYCVLDGTFDVVRFGRRPPPGEMQKFLMKRASQEMQRDEVPTSGATPAAENDDPLRIPEEMKELPELQVASVLHKQATFRGGDAFGPEGDAWIVAGEGGAELLVSSLQDIRNLERACGGLQEQVEADVRLLSRSGLFKSCPPHVLLTAVSEIFDLREALDGEDPMALWPGLVVIREGELQLWSDSTNTSSTRPGSPGGSSAGGGTGGTSPRDIGSAQELCILGPGDSLGDEKLFGGPPAIPFTRSRVMSFRLEAWVLPPERGGDAEDIGLFTHLREHRDAERRELQERARAANRWSKVRPRALGLAKQAQRTIDYVRGEVDPPPKIIGGVALSWKPR